MKFAKVFTLILALAGLVTTVGCNSSATFDEWFASISQQRAVVEAQMNSVPYKKEQQDVLKTYFKNIQDFANGLSDEATRKAVNKRLQKEDLKAVCEGALLDRTAWTLIVRNCTRNQFFLCAEEVRIYDRNLAAIRQQLDSGLLPRIKETIECNRAFNIN